MFEEGRRHMGSVVKRLSSVAWRKTVGLSVVSVLVVSVIAIAEIGVLIVASPPQLPTTGAEMWEYLFLAVLLVLLGLLVASGHRRDSLNNWGSPTFSEFWGDEDSG